MMDQGFVRGVSYCAIGCLLLVTLHELQDRQKEALYQEVMDTMEMNATRSSYEMEMGRPISFLDLPAGRYTVITSDIPDQQGLALVRLIIPTADIQFFVSGLPLTTGDSFTMA